jgi:hypothetical protein
LGISIHDERKAPQHPRVEASVKKHR